MSSHKSRLTKISTETIIKKFKIKPRHAKLNAELVTAEADSDSSDSESDDGNGEGSFYLLFIFIKTLYMSQNVILLGFFFRGFFSK